MKRILFLFLLLLVCFLDSCVFSGKIKDINKYLTDKWGEEIYSENLLYEYSEYGWQGEGNVYAVYNKELDSFDLENYYNTAEEKIVYRNSTFYFNALLKELIRYDELCNVNVYAPIEYRIDFENDIYYWKHKSNNTGQADMFVIYVPDNGLLYYYIQLR